MKLIVAAICFFAAGAIIGATKDATDVPLFEIVLALILVLAGALLV